jgi:hypothetical protein
MDFVGTRWWGSRVSAPPSQADRNNVGSTARKQQVTEVLSVMRVEVFSLEAFCPCGSDMPVRGLWVEQRFRAAFRSHPNLSS